MRPYMKLYHAAYRAERTEVFSIKDPEATPCVVSVKAEKDGRAVAEHTVELERGAELTVHTRREIPPSALRWIAKRLLSRKFWDFCEQFGVVYAGILVLVIVWQYDPRSRRHFIVLFAAVAASGIVVWALQRTVGKLRPDVCPGAPQYLPFLRGWLQDGGLSFPSGHTTCAFATATFLAFLYPRLRRLFYLLAAATGLSRIIALAHWPSDVYAGALLGHAAARIMWTRFPRIEGAVLARFPKGLQGPLSGAEPDDIG